MLENFHFAWRGIWSHKMRSFLTMLGVIIGIASIIAIVSTIKGTNEQIMQNLIGSGNNNVTVSLTQGGDTYWMDNGVPSGVTPVSDSQREDIRNLDGVADASFYTERTYADSITNGSISLDSGKILGVDTHYLSTTRSVVYRGRAFTARDYTNMDKVVLLDENAAGTLFPAGGAVGSFIEIKGEPYEVVGLFQKQQNYQPVINSIDDWNTYNQDSYGTVLIPGACWPISYYYDEPENCVVRADRTEDMSRVGKAAAEIMNESVSGSSDSISYQAEDLLEKARNKQQLASSTNNMLIWIASIALLVGGIGVMNIMLVSVTERTAEIGLKKALGARKNRILGQFLTESALLTSIGGVLGVIAGIILAFAISKVSGTPVAISVPSIFLGVGFSMLIGIVFGLLPSVKAANMSPIDALRRE